MSMEVFPSLPGLDIAITRQSIRATSILTSRSGKELRAKWWSEPRYKYSLTFNVLRQTGYDTTEDELAVLHEFWMRHYGPWDTFLFDDPVDGERRRVRFVSDDFDLTRVAEDAFESRQLELISVK